MKLNKLNKQKKNIFSEKKLETVAFIFAAIIFAVVSYFHEPWFDEAQAWQIARCASLKDLLFKIPHYEGHPPLWHLILALPAKLGAPYEISLKLISGFITLTVIALILYSSPFPRPVRLLLPFNYFVFYQYGIISRPYGLFLLSMILAARTFQKKDSHPFRFLFTLGILCLCSAYGILVAGGICFCWLIDIVKDKNPLKINSLLSDKRIIGLFGILIFAVILILEILPKSDTCATNMEINTSIFFRIAYCFFSMLPDNLITNVLQGDELLINATFIPWISIILSALVGIGILVIIWFTSEKGKFKYYMVPFVFFAMFSAIKYCCGHHIGIVTTILLFWLWINCENYTAPPALIRFKEKYKNELQKKRVRCSIIGILSLFIVIPVTWTACACFFDINYQYYGTRTTVQFIKENIPENAKIMATWTEYDDDNSSGTKINTNIIGFGVVILPYFDNNIFMNLNNGDNRLAYTTHIFASDEDNNENTEIWRKKGIPDVLIGKVNLEYVYGDEISLADYAPVYKICPTGITIWKNLYDGGDMYLGYEYIYVRRDLLEQYGLTEIEADPYLYPY